MITTGKQVTLPFVIDSEQQKVSFAVVNQSIYLSIYKSIPVYIPVYHYIPVLGI